MQNVFNRWLMLGLVAGAFASCSQDQSEPSSPSQILGDEVAISLDAEVSVDDEDWRALSYTLGKNGKGQLVPLPKFTDKQVVPVHTILKSSSGQTVAKTVNWRYDLASRKLVLRPNDGHSITVSGFNNDGGVKWYISGLIGGTLQSGTTRVSFQGRRALTGVSGAEGDAVGSLEVPYAFGWIELTINKSKAKDSNNSYSSAKVPTNANIKFSPLGSLISYTLGNDHGYNFTPNGFVVSSNSWGDKGVFELNTTIPATNARSVLPAWTEDSATSSMYYTFASGQAPGAIANGANASKVYYAWAMPHTTQPATVQSTVMLKGTSARPTTSTYRDYTNTWPTNYSPKTTGSAGKIVKGRVHKLTAKITGALLELPFDYVTPYNLAGGISVKPPLHNGTPPPGVQGSLRFAMSHNNDASGYYVGYTLYGQTNQSFNPKGVNLTQSPLVDLDGKTITLAHRYHIPSQEEWSLFFPKTTPALTWGTSQQLDVQDQLRYGNKKGGSYTSDFSETFTVGNNKVTYAIRFKGGDNSLKSAYRFTRVGPESDWDYGAWATPSDPTLSRYIVDVVYLGVEASPTTLATISNESWWTARRARTITNIFPMVGRIYTGVVESINDYQGYGHIDQRNAEGHYTAYDMDSYMASSYLSTTVPSVIPSYSGIVHGNSSKHHGLPIRLFKNWWAL